MIHLALRCRIWACRTTSSRTNDHPPRSLTHAPLGFASLEKLDYTGRRQDGLALVLPQVHCVLCVAIESRTPLRRFCWKEKEWPPKPFCSFLSYSKARWLERVMTNKHRTKQQRSQISWPHRWGHFSWQCRTNQQMLPKRQTHSLLLHGRW